MKEIALDKGAITLGNFDTSQGEIYILLGKEKIVLELDKTLLTTKGTKVLNGINMQLVKRKQC